MSLLSGATTFVTQNAVFPIDGLREMRRQFDECAAAGQPLVAHIRTEAVIPLSIP